MVSGLTATLRAVQSLSAHYISNLQANQEINSSNRKRWINMDKSETESHQKCQLETSIQLTELIVRTIQIPTLYVADTWQSLGVPSSLNESNVTKRVYQGLLIHRHCPMAPPWRISGRDVESSEFLESPRFTQLFVVTANLVRLILSIDLKRVSMKCADDVHRKCYLQIIVMHTQNQLICAGASLQSCLCCPCLWKLPNNVRSRRVRSTFTGSMVVKILFAPKGAWPWTRHVTIWRRNSLPRYWLNGIG
jgi:hypothetical protein